MSDDLDPRILARWLAGRLDPEERQVLDRWIAADPGHAAELEQVRQLWRLAGEVTRAEAELPDEREAKRWARLSSTLRAQQGAPPTPSARRAAPALTLELPGRRWSAGRGAVAAALALVAGGGFWLASHERSRATETPPSMRVYETARGERAEFRLRDGTRIMLNVASRLRVPADFGVRSREVYLEGGAYFEVVHDSVRSFAVHAGDIVARDLGTEFTIGAYPEQPHARVVVREGLVALRPATTPDSTPEATLRPGEQGRLDDRGVPNVQPADTVAEFAWTGGTLIFDGAPLREALPQLGRWFDLEFRLADASLGRIQLAATLTNQPTDDALRFLAASLGLRAERRGQVVTLYPTASRRAP